MKRKSLPPFLLLLLSQSFTVNAKPPNNLFIIADGLGWQDSSTPFTQEPTPLNKQFHSPSLERLANEGMNFTQAYANAVCPPFCVSFLTGENEARHDVTQWTFLSETHSSDLEHPTLSFARGTRTGFNLYPKSHIRSTQTNFPSFFTKKGIGP